MLHTESEALNAVLTAIGPDRTWFDESPRGTDAWGRCRTVCGQWGIRADGYFSRIVVIADQCAASVQRKLDLRTVWRLLGCS
jgi:hypothetical protein